MIGSVLLAWVVLARTELVPSGVSGIALGAVLLAAVSWLDDLRGLSPVVRLLAQAAAVAIGVLSARSPGPRGRLLYLAAIGLGLGLVDQSVQLHGRDRRARRQRGGGDRRRLAAVRERRGRRRSRAAVLAAAVIGAAIGFLVWNWSPARIFLGDVGSVPLGYVLGFLLLDLAVRGCWKIALILPLYFLADATITLARRLLRGERVWQAHREHFYQQAVRRGLGHAAVVKRVIAADLDADRLRLGGRERVGRRFARRVRRDRRNPARRARSRLLRLAEGSEQSPISAAMTARSSPDPPRADFGQRQERESLHSAGRLSRAA